jgi:predicted DNA repair protein MutK
VAVLTKIATKKTTGILGDDLAVNAQQVSGVDPDRELPVVWAVAKGSAINKAILIPSSLVISYFLPWLVTVLLLCGGAYLCFEGFEKIWHKLFDKSDHKKGQNTALGEVEKIKGAVRTDFILSAEIIVITLGTVTGEPVSKQFLVLFGISLIMTIGVYGLVAMIIKLDDFGLYLIKPEMARWKKIIGSGLLSGAPYLMKSLGIIGTVAMFMVGGGIITHAVPVLHHVQNDLPKVAAVGMDMVVGLGLGGLVMLAVSMVKKFFARH